jgi:hypothetical protein
MSSTLLVSTRKGLFHLAHRARQWSIAGRHFMGDNVAFTLVDARDGSWYSALDLGHFGAKLQHSNDRGASWTELAVPAFGPDDEVVMGDGKPATPATLKKLWVLAAGHASQPGPRA